LEVFLRLAQKQNPTTTSKFLAVESTRIMVDARVENLASFINSLEEIQKHKLLLQSMQYPRTAKLDKHDNPLETCYYECDNGQCDFSSCLRQVENSVELRAYGSQGVITTIVKDIQTHQNDYMASKMDGYQVYRCAYDMLRVQRKENDKLCKAGRTGFIEYNDLRNEEFRWIERKKVEAMDAALRTINVGYRCSIM